MHVVKGLHLSERIELDQFFNIYFEHLEYLSSTIGAMNPIKTCEQCDQLKIILDVYKSESSHCLEALAEIF
jgi:hypothetical protein